MGITIFKFFIRGGISSDIWLEITVKLNFRPYIPRYTKIQNVNFEYSYPLSGWSNFFFFYHGKGQRGGGGVSNKKK